MCKHSIIDLHFVAATMDAKEEESLTMVPKIEDLGDLPDVYVEAPKKPLLNCGIDVNNNNITNIMKKKHCYETGLVKVRLIKIKGHDGGGPEGLRAQPDLHTWPSALTQD